MSKKDFRFYVLFISMVIVSLSCERLYDRDADAYYDRIPPDISIIGNDGIIVGDHDNHYDTIVLLHTIYNEPTKVVDSRTFTGFIAKDNFTGYDDIITEVVLQPFFDEERLSFSGLRKIIYNATDERGNKNSAIRNLHVKNIADHLGGDYTFQYSGHSCIAALDGFVLNGEIEVAPTISGHLIMLTHYHAYITNPHSNETYNYRVKLRLNMWSPDFSHTYSSPIGYMGISDEQNDLPFFEALCYEQAMDIVPGFNRLFVEPTQFNHLAWSGNPCGNIHIQQQMEFCTELGKEIPKSYIEYHPGTNQVKALHIFIILEHDNSYDNDYVSIICTPKPPEDY